MQYTTRVRAALRRRPGIRYLIDYNRDYRRTTFLAGTARGGTTWLSEILNYRNEYRYIFEPFYPAKVPLVRPFGTRRYLRPTDDDPELLSIARTIVSGEIRNKWTERFNRRFVVDQRLIKCIRANLMLRWLHGHFPEMPILLLLRHPCATAHSYAKQGWRGSVEPLLAQSTLIDDYLRPYKTAIAGAKDPFEKAVFIWCIETLVPLMQFRWGELHVVFYETLIRQPDVEIGRLFAYLGKEFDASVLARVTEPSRTSRKNSAISTGADLVDSWRKGVRREQLRRSMEIVQMFGLDGIYTEASLPDTSGVAAILGKQPEALPNAHTT